MALLPIGQPILDDWKQQGAAHQYPFLKAAKVGTFTLNNQEQRLIELKCGHLVSCEKVRAVLKKHIESKQVHPKVHLTCLCNRQKTQVLLDADTSSTIEDWRKPGPELELHERDKRLRAIAEWDAIQNQKEPEQAAPRRKWRCDPANTAVMLALALFILQLVPVVR